MVAKSNNQTNTSAITFYEHIDEHLSKHHTSLVGIVEPAAAARSLVFVKVSVKVFGTVFGNVFGKVSVAKMSNMTKMPKNEFECSGHVNNIYL